MNILKFIILIFIVLSISSCGAKGDLSTLRNNKIYMSEILPINYEIVKQNIINDRSKNGSLLKMFENTNNDMITLVRQNDFNGEIMCFFDFVKKNDKTLVIVYDWVCAKDFILKTINSAREK